MKLCLESDGTNVHVCYTEAILQNTLLADVVQTPANAALFLNEQATEVGDCGWSDDAE